ncbi:MAG: thiolase family protein [Microbacteriaceae bacterium]
MTQASYVYDGVRTPFARYGKAYSEIRPDDLGAEVIAALITRNPGLDPERVDDVIFGNANGAGEDNRNVARMSAILAGLPTSIPGATVNRLCGSSIEAVIQGSRAIETGDAEVIIAGGVESMTRAPWVILKNSRPFPAANETLHSTTLGWRMVNKKMDKRWTIPLGETAELLADHYKISREEQDAFALRSHSLADAAWQAGIFDQEIVIPEGTTLTRDENIRADSTPESLAGLKPAFLSDGSVTAGNSSPLSDGSSAVLLSRLNDDLGEPLARITGRAVFANDPNIFGIAPVEAANRALARAGRSWAEVDFVELNEAFAAQSLACLREWKELDPEKLNVHGGAIAIGHPLGASGTRLISRVAHELKARGSGVAIATICIGVGQGLAVVLER